MLVLTIALVVQCSCHPFCSSQRPPSCIAGGCLVSILLRIKICFLNRHRVLVEPRVNVHEVATTCELFLFFILLFKWRVHAADLVTPKLYPVRKPTATRSCFGTRFHVSFSHRLDDDGVGSVLFLALLKRVAGSNGQSLASTVERKSCDGVIIFPRLLQSPPVDAIPHNNVAVTAASCECAKSRMKCDGIDRVNNVEIFGFVGNPMALEGIPKGSK